MDFARWYLQKNTLNPDFGSTVLFTDECTFTCDGTFNTHNSHQWADVNPYASSTHAYQRRFSINVWAGIIGDHLLGPYLLPERLNGKKYLTFLQQVLSEMMTDVPPRIRLVMWFQQDGAPAHYAPDVRNYLNATFPNQWIRRGSPVPWQRDRPIFHARISFCGGHLKSLMYESPIESAEVLVARLSAAAGEVRDTPGVFQRVRESLLRRCTVCIASNGECFEQLL